MVVPGYRANLPSALTSFIGREGDVEDVKSRLAAGRLVTLTGVGGSGKTRLALQVARTVLGRYAHGVWLVELGALAEPSLVPQTVAAVFDLHELADQPIAAVLTATL